MKLFSQKKKTTKTEIKVAPKKEKTFKNIEIFGAKFSVDEKIAFFRNVATMIESGVSIVEALEISAEQVKSKRVKKAILSMAEDTKNGVRLSRAMAKFPRLFPEYIYEAIEMGDIAGKLTNIMYRIADDLEKDEELRKKVMNAILYPIVIVFLMVIVLIVFAFYILPNIAEIFRDLDAPLPLPTKIILTSSEFIKNNPLLLSEVIFGVFLFFFIMLKTKRGHYIIHYLILKFPIFGVLIKEYNLVLLFRSLQMLFSSGLSLNDAVQIAKKTTTNDVYKKTLASIEPKLVQGVPFSRAVSPFPFLFPIQAQKIVWVGEKTGRISTALTRLMEYYEKSADYRVRILTTIIEPVLMVIVGICVGGLALSIFLPIYGLIKVI